MNYKYLLFDLDGTLTDPKEGITKSVQYALHALGVEEPDLDQLVCFIGPPLQESFRDFYGFDEEKAQQAVLKYRERFRDVGIFENFVWEGIPELLDDLKRAGKRIALATSKPEPFARVILDKYELMSYFDEVVGSCMDGTRGTKTEVIKEVLRRLHMRDQEKTGVLMIGDRKHDVCGAKACGIDSVGVEFGYAEEGELKKAGATYLVNTVEELKSLLLKDK